MALQEIDGTLRYSAVLFSVMLLPFPTPLTNSTNPAPRGHKQTVLLPLATAGFKSRRSGSSWATSGVQSLCVMSIRITPQRPQPRPPPPDRHQSMLEILIFLSEARQVSVAFVRVREYELDRTRVEAA